MLRPPRPLSVLLLLLLLLLLSECRPMYSNHPVIYYYVDVLSAKRPFVPRTMEVNETSLGFKESGHSNDRRRRAQNCHCPRQFEICSLRACQSAVLGLMFLNIVRCVLRYPQCEQHSPDLCIPEMQRHARICRASVPGTCL